MHNYTDYEIHSRYQQASDLALSGYRGLLKDYFKVILSYFYSISLSIQHYIKNSIFPDFLKIAGKSFHILVFNTYF